MNISASIASYQSATFQERGVSVPFTTPTLAGARVRQDARHGLVLLVPNPSGGRGIYVVPWFGLRDMCSPTLHDGMLFEALIASRGGPITPRVVRAAARRVAAAGAAGRPAQAAAIDAMEAEAASEQAANHFLVHALAAQTTAQASAAEIASLAAAVYEVGIGPQAAQADIPVRLGRLKALRAELSAFMHMGADDAGSASMACSVADLTIRCAEHVLRAAQQRTADLGGLLYDWHARSGDLAAVLSRPAWVLDGWGLPCLLWSTASGVSARRAAVLEIAPMLTTLPTEAGGWTGVPINAETGEAGQALRSMAGLSRHGRFGLGVLDLVARNEQLRARAA